MKKFVIICVAIAIVFLVGASFFIFNEEIDNVYENGVKLIIGSDWGGGDIDETNVSGGAGGGAVSESEGGGGGFSGEGESLTCVTRQVQYSLKNFVNDVRCLNGTEQECFNLIGNCSVDVYNFDGGTGNFAIKYYLIDSSENRVDSQLIQKEVLVNDPKTFSVIFVKNGGGGFDGNLACTFTMESIPRKEYCS